MTETIGAVLERLEANGTLHSRGTDDPEAIEIPPDGLSIDLLRAVYRSNKLPLPTRMRAAMACLKHEVPSLGITAVVTDQGLAELLDKRLERMKQIEQAAVIEAKPTPQIEAKPVLSRTNDRRFRRV